jgi:hypothetical protein
MRVHVQVLDLWEGGLPASPHTRPPAICEGRAAALPPHRPPALFEGLRPSNPPFNRQLDHLARKLATILP